MSRNRAKGTAAESVVVRWFANHGWPWAERRALTGSKDKGDLTGMPGLVIEVKSAVRIDLPGWLRETTAERNNASADYGVLVVKPKGYGETRIDEWPAVMTLGALTHLLHAAGYGDPKPEQEIA